MRPWLKHGQRPWESNRQFWVLYSLYTPPNKLCTSGYFALVSSNLRGGKLRIAARTEGISGQHSWYITAPPQAHSVVDSTGVSMKAFLSHKRIAINEPASGFSDDFCFPNIVETYGRPKAPMWKSSTTAALLRIQVLLQWATEYKSFCWLPGGSHK